MTARYFVAAFALVLCLTQATAQDSAPEKSEDKLPEVAQEPAVRGRTLLKNLCSSCHAIDKFDASPRPAAPPFRIIGQSFDIDEFAKRLQGGLASSHPDMPEVSFHEDEAEAIVVYLRTIQE